MPAWLPFAAVLGTMLTLSLLAWAACKVGGDADAADDAARQIADSEAFPMPRAAAPIPDVVPLHSTPISRKGPDNHAA